jgi:hypothetical protein
MTDVAEAWIDAKACLERVAALADAEVREDLQLIVADFIRTIEENSLVIGFAQSVAGLG